jgi:hypothetical protein
MIRERVRELLKKGDKNTVILFLEEIRKLIPPSDDYGITLFRKGSYEYVLDRRGLVMISLNQDEYLPYFSARSKRIGIESLSEEMLKSIKNNWKDILAQLRDIALDYSKRDNKYLKVVDEITGVIFENL